MKVTSGASCRMEEAGELEQHCIQLKAASGHRFPSCCQPGMAVAGLHCTHQWVSISKLDPNPEGLLLDQGQ